MGTWDFGASNCSTDFEHVYECQVLGTWGEVGGLQWVIRVRRASVSAHPVLRGAGFQGLGYLDLTGFMFGFRSSFRVHGI